LDQFELTLDCTPSLLTAKTDDTTILDYGCTSNFLSAPTPCTNKQASPIPLNVNMPNGTSIQSSHTSDLLLTALPPDANRAHILPGLVHNSLIYVGQVWDSGCNVNFTKEKVEVTKGGKCLMLGSRDPHSRVWRVNLKEEVKPVRKSECNHAHDTSNQKELINYVRGAGFSPVKSTWISAIKNGNFTSWPGLTEQSVDKYLSKSLKTGKGHPNQQRMHARSTKIKEEEDCVNETETALNNGLKTHCVYAATIDAGKIYTDQTERFPVVSSKGNKYIMVLYEYDGNAIIAEPIKNRTTVELLR
jgi:hypothetical protein